MSATGDVANYGKRKGIIREIKASIAKPESELEVEVTLTKGFCKEALRTFQEFLLRLNQAYRQWRSGRSSAP